MPGRIFASLRGYRIGWLPRDLVAGIMLAAIAIPGQLATARLAGLLPETGLYAFAAGTLAFAAFGANRFASVAADSTIAPIFAGGLAALAATGTADYADLAAWLALMVGVILVIVGLLRAGWLADLLSIPVTIGFLAGIAVHIIVGELPTLLGLPDEQGHVVHRLIRLAGRVTEADPYTAAIGVAVLVVTLAARRVSAKIPGALIGLAVAGLAVAAFHLGDKGVALLGPLEVELPRLTLPSLRHLHDFATLVPLALVVAMVCMMQTAAVVRTYPSEPGRPEDVSRDFAGVGAGSLVAGLFGAFPVDASPPSTAIVVESGGRSQLAALVAVGLMAALVFLATGLLDQVPQAALAGILIYIAIRIFRLDEMIAIYRRGGLEILLVAASAALVVAFPIETGMLLAIVLSFLHSLFVVARPLCAELARVPGSTVWWPPGTGEPAEYEPGVLVFAPAAPINFTNAEHICGRIAAALEAAREPVRLLVIEGSGIIDIDFTGSRILQERIAEWRARGVDVALARLADQRARIEAARTGLVEALGTGRVFHSVEEAVRAIGPRARAGAASAQR